MGPVQVIFSAFGSLVVYGLVIAAVYKLFQIATDLSEIKDTLQEIRRNTQYTPPAGWTSASKQSSPESLMRALAAPSPDPAEVDSQH
jgi:hypothetical protein